MASSTMNIPKTITVGYQDRGGTYTGKLAYVIYTDEKGKLRKEKSWNTWRTQNLGSEKFDNVPTSGFVLNKGVGGVRGSSSSWNPRNEYIRVYDPRDFEFEISMANLLFILQECTSTKGKGLEGDFVYSWDGADLVLLPICSNEYVECSKFTARQSAKLTKKDMVEGHSYLMKNMDEGMYLGHHPYFEENNSHYHGSFVKCFGKKHVFLNLKKKNEWSPTYIAQTGFTKIAEKISEEALPQYAEAYDKFKKSSYNLTAAEIKLTVKKLPPNFNDNFIYCKKFLIKEAGEYFTASISGADRHDFYSRDYKKTFDITKSRTPFSPVLKNGGCSVPKINRDDKLGNFENVTLAELHKKEFYTASLITENGKKHKLI